MGRYLRMQSQYLDLIKVSDKIIQAMFGKNDMNINNEEWATPKLKSVVCGESISPSLVL